MATQRQQAAHDHGGEGTMRYIFGDCELDAARCELRCASKTVLVEPRVFKVLVCEVFEQGQPDTTPVP